MGKGSARFDINIAASAKHPLEYHYGIVKGRIGHGCYLAESHQVGANTEKALALAEDS